MKNTAALIIVSLLGFLTIAITGRLVIDNRKSENTKIIQVVPEQKSEIIQPQQVQPTIPEKPVERQYPYYSPEYHNRNEFWLGYSDGWYGRYPQLNCPEYIRGHEIGLYDRRYNNQYYYRNHYPFGIYTPIFRFRL